MPEENVTLAVIDKVVPKGKHGPYAVAKIEGTGQLVTFLLMPPVWEENRWPDNGTFVVLYDLTKKRAGWRAGLARFFRPTDEERSTQ